MRFANPGMLLAWATLPVVALLLGVAMARQRAVLARLGAPAAVQRLAAERSLGRRVIKVALILAAAFALILALARPQWGRRSEPLSRRGVDVVLVLDVSESMLAADVAPDRLRRAKALAADLAGRLQGNRVGLVAFAGSAFVQCPLTLDVSAVRLFLDVLEAGDVPDAGSDVGEALRVALDAFPPGSSGRRVLILISDGEDHAEGARQMAETARGQGVAIYTVGVGTPSGGPIPLAGADSSGGGYKKDREGRVVTTRLDAEVLASLAEIGGGRPLLASASLAESRQLAAEIDRMEKADISSRMVTSHRERFQIPLAIAVLLLATEPFVPAGRRRPRSA